MTDLRADVQKALDETSDDRALAAALLRGETGRRVIELAAMSADEVQEALGYAPDTLRTMLRKSRTLPQPFVPGRLWRRCEVMHYRDEHASIGNRTRQKGGGTAPIAPTAPIASIAPIDTTAPNSEP